MKSWSLVLLLFLSFPISRSFSQNIPAEALQQMAGDWDGTLKYLDYSDDITSYTLDTDLDASWNKSKLTLSFAYTEPNGKVVKGKQYLKPGKKANQIDYDGTWIVREFTETEKGWKASFEKMGQDNSLNALLRTNIVLTSNKLTIEKQVKYANTEEFFQRNIYTLKRSVVTY